MEEWIATPQGCSLRKDDAPTTLKALAVGAVSYKWTKNGEVIGGGENGELEVSWRRTKTPDVYAVTPVYSVFGTEVEGEPISATVENIPPGAMLIVR